MEISEKLDIFYKAAIDAATRQSESALEGQKQAYQEAIDAYEKKKQENWQERERMLEEKVRKEVNREVSEQLMAKKRAYHQAEEEKQELIFSKVVEKLAAYRKTEAYREKLCTMMERVKEYADGTEVTVYLDELDAQWTQELEARTGCSVTLTDEAFLGGIKAKIPAKNLLLDETFKSRLLEEREKFVFPIIEKEG